MKNKKIKNNKNFRSGFVILFAVTLSAILLSIALGVANISFKEVSFSTSARDSNDAFLAADTGAECALFYDKLENGSFPLQDPGPVTITCASDTQNNITVDSTFGTNTALYNFIVTGLGSQGKSCAKVEISKDGSVTPIETLITSTGYNIGNENCVSTNNHRVERELLVSSYVGATPAYVPPPSGVTLSCGELCSIPYGSNTTLSWITSPSITSCSASGGLDSDWTTSPDGSTKSWPTGNQTLSNLTSTQTYTITCSGVSGEAQDSVTVEVGSAPTPVVTTNSASSVTSSTATLNGSANPSGYASTGWFRYGTTNPGTCNDTFGTRSPASGGTSLGSGSASVAYTSGISGLSVNTTYYYCAIASNSNGTAFGTVSSFATTVSCSYTGGTVSDSGSEGYRYHTFTSSGTFVINCPKTIDYLVVAGGGGGGDAAAYSPYAGELGSGGGGGGGVISSTSVFGAGTYTITVGNGGGAHVSGNNSSISGGVATAIGGGRGGHSDAEYYYATSGAAGGSGGGGASTGGGGSPPGGAGTSGQGNAGGAGGRYSSGGAGGGGAGGPGGDGEFGGAGGSGVSINFLYNTSYSWGGFGGQTYNPYASYKGSGGSGAAPGGNGSPGVNGIVILRYVYP